MQNIKINKVTLIALLGLVLSGLGYLIYAQTPDSSVVDIDTDTTTVTLTSAGYVPAQIRVTVGTTVTFVSEMDKPHWPASNLHPSHQQYASFDPQRPLEPQETWSFTFDRVGEWDFHDHIRSYYVGTVYVEVE